MTNTEKKMPKENIEENAATFDKPFETDVSKLLDIVANALYSNRDVFLRELISNAADACDRLRYEALQNSKFNEGSAPFNITLTPDNNDTTLTITDNGIGMNRDELIENLGTIARSGTANILESLKSAGQEKEMNLIGQFGVGFYSSFMVSKNVTAISQKAGDKQVWFWESDGRTGFNIREATKDEAKTLKDNHGTSITLNMKADAFDYLLDDKINEIVLSYSDHIEIPIYLDSAIAKEKKERAPINAASALWTRPKNEITPKQYKEFYHHIGHFFDDPILVTHWTAEGVIEYTSLLYIPSLRPWDLYDPERKNALRLYVKRVYITDQLDALLYPWLRFVRGIVDSQDLPLNISREMLQNNSVVNKIRNGITNKILGEIDKLSSDNQEAFDALWLQFGAVIKEGLYDAIEHRKKIFKVCRFFTTNDPEKQTSLSDYIERMKDKQDTIYYLSGENAESLRNSPQLEGFTSRGLEVLIFTDTVDEFWLQQITEFEGKKFQSVTKGRVDLSAFDTDKQETDTDKNKSDNEEHDLTHLVAFLQTELSDQIASVRLSRRLTESPVCLVAGENAVDMNMEKVMKIHQKYEPGVKRVLEINPKHALIQKLGDMTNDDMDQEILKDSAQLLMDQALIIQGDTLKDPSAFAKRMAKFMEKGLFL
jgi:molecular chaperone HtpG